MASKLCGANVTVPMSARTNDARHLSPRQSQHRCGEIDADDGVSFGERPRHRHPCAAAKVEHARTARKIVQQLQCARRFTGARCVVGGGAQVVGVAHEPAIVACSVRCGFHDRSLAGALVERAACQLASWARQRVQKRMVPLALRPHLGQSKRRAGRLAPHAVQSVSSTPTRALHEGHGRSSVGVSSGRAGGWGASRF